MASATSTQKVTPSTSRQLKYFRRTRRAAWILAVLFALGAAGSRNVSTSTESIETFGYTLATILFIWGLDSHVRIRRLR